MAVEEVLYKSAFYQDGKGIMATGMYVGMACKKIENVGHNRFFTHVNNVQELIDSKEGIFGFIHTDAMVMSGNGWANENEKPRICTIVTLDDAMDLVKNHPKKLEKYLEHVIGHNTRGYLVKIISNETGQAFILTPKEADYSEKLGALAKIIFTNPFPRDIASLTGEHIDSASIRSAFTLVNLNAKFVSIKGDEYNSIQKQFDDAKKSLCESRTKLPELKASEQKAPIPKSTGYSTLTTAALTIAGFAIGFAANPANWDALSHQFEQMNLRKSFGF